MPALPIHPSLGKRDGQINAAGSLLRTVALRSTAARPLTADDRWHLERRYGDDARFWGTYRHNLKKYSRLTAAFELVSIDYAVVNAALGLKPNNHFQAMASYEGARAEAVIESLGL